MTEPSLISLFVRPLNQLGIPYQVTGGMASVVYGEPRMTRDIDDDDAVLAPIEAVMPSKLRYYQTGRSDRHLRDIHQMLRISGELVDRAILELWASRLGVLSEWKQAL